MILESKTPLDQALAIHLAQQFHLNDFGWIVANNLDTPNWITRKDRDLCIGEFVREYLDIERLIGVNFGKTTKYALIDLDYNSQYHPSFDRDRYKDILHALEKIGLTRYIVIQSSHSRGLHIYFPLPTAVPTFQLAAAIRVTLIAAGFEIKNGQLEIFPNTKRFAKAKGDYSHYHPHRMPLQPESGSWLMEDDGLSPQPIVDSIEAQLGAFLNQWELAAAGQDPDLLDRKLPQLYARYKANKRKYRDRSDDWNSKEAEKWRLDLLLTIETGWYDYHQTYILLPKILAYCVVFLKLEGEALYEEMLDIILNAPGYYQHCRHQHEIEKIIRSWIKTNERTQYYQPYCSHPARRKRYPFPQNEAEAAAAVADESKQPHPANLKRSSDAQERISVAYSIVSPQFTSTTTIGQRKEAIRAEIQNQYGTVCSETTLNKYKNIWHPEFNAYYTPNGENEETPEPIPEKEISCCVDKTENDAKIARPDDQQGLLHTQISMICSCSLQDLQADLATDLSAFTSTQPDRPEDEIAPEINLNSTKYITYYDLRPKEVVTPQPTKPGKCEVMGAALSKIAALAAIVINTITATTALEKVATEAIETPQTSVTTPIETEELEQPPPGDRPHTQPKYPTTDTFDQRSISTITDPPPAPGEIVAAPPPGVTAKIAPPDSTLAQPLCEGKRYANGTRIANANGDGVASRIARGEATPSRSVSQRREAAPLENRQKNALVEPSPDPSGGQNSHDSPPKLNPRPIGQKSPPRDRRDCPNCQIPTPPAELDRWQMCQFCAQKILWQRFPNSG